jgi:hypothetical protein
MRRVRGDAEFMSPKPLDRNQEAELVRLRQQNAKWTGRSRIHRLALSSAAIFSTWV